MSLFLLHLFFTSTFAFSWCCICFLPLHLKRALLCLNLNSEGRSWVNNAYHTKSAASCRFSFHTMRWLFSIPFFYLLVMNVSPSPHDKSPIFCFTGMIRLTSGPRFILLWMRWKVQQSTWDKECVRIIEWSPKRGFNFASFYLTKWFYFIGCAVSFPVVASQHSYCYSLSVPN